MSRFSMFTVVPVVVAAAVMLAGCSSGTGAQQHAIGDYLKAHPQPETVDVQLPNQLGIYAPDGHRQAGTFGIYPADDSSTALSDFVKMGWLTRTTMTLVPEYQITIAPFMAEEAYGLPGAPGAHPNGSPVDTAVYRYTHAGNGRLPFSNKDILGTMISTRVSVTYAHWKPDAVDSYSKPIQSIFFGKYRRVHAQFRLSYDVSHKTARYLTDAARSATVNGVTPGKSGTVGATLLRDGMTANFTCAATRTDKGWDVFGCARHADF